MDLLACSYVVFRFTLQPVHLPMCCYHSNFVIRHASRECISLCRRTKSLSYKRSPLDTMLSGLVLKGHCHCARLIRPLHVHSSGTVSEDIRATVRVSEGLCDTALHSPRGRYDRAEPRASGQGAHCEHHQPMGVLLSQPRQGGPKILWAQMKCHQLYHRTGSTERAVLSLRQLRRGPKQ